MNVEQARYYMIEQQIRPWQVSDPHVLELLGAVKREDFLPNELKPLAFADMELPLPGGRSLLTPSVEARLFQEARVQRHERVLQLGVGTGYVTALLAHRAQHVLALDLDAELVSTVRANLQKAGIVNVEVREASCTAGAEADSPFDVIFLTGSVAQAPTQLLSQLKVGGRLVAIVGEEPIMCATTYTRKSDGSFDAQQRFDTVAQRLPGFAEPSGFRL